MSAGEQQFTEINNVGQDYKHSDCFAVGFYCLSALHHVSYLLVESRVGEIFPELLKRNEHLSTVTDSDARELNICLGSSDVKISFGISWMFLIYSG